MLGEHAGDVIVDYHDLVDLVAPLPREHANRRGAAADPHALFQLAVDFRRLAGGDDYPGAAVDRQLDSPPVAEVEQSLAGDAPLLLAAVRQMVDAAQREHLRAVFAGRDMADRLALRPDRGAFCSEMTIGVDLQLDAAIAVNAL